MSKKVLVAMSGGVDSSVAAYLLTQAGYQVVGSTMCIGYHNDHGDTSTTCCDPGSIRDARRVCTFLGIPHYVMDVSHELAELVIDNYLSEYLHGRTPNPCIECNRHLKFGLLLERARALGFDYLATGHYAMIDYSGTTPFLKRPKDKVKDQTYFLYRIRKEALDSVVFPLADLTKQEVRAVAARLELPVARRKESQDLCFVRHRTSHGFFSRFEAYVRPGVIVDLKGNVLGQHSGTVFYTIGQRRGLGIASRFPLYVVAIDAAKGVITVGTKDALQATGLIASQLHLLAPELPQRAHAKIRYRSSLARCTIRTHHTPDRIIVTFDQPQSAVTPGQSIVLYDGDRVLGGGVIEQALNDDVSAPRQEGDQHV